MQEGSEGKLQCSQLQKLSAGMAAKTEHPENSVILQVADEAQLAQQDPGERTQSGT